MKVFKYEVWYKDGEYELNYFTEEGLAWLEGSWVEHGVTHYKVQLTDLTELPPF